MSIVSTYKMRYVKVHKILASVKMYSLSVRTRTISESVFSLPEMSASYVTSVSENFQEVK